MSLDIKNFIPWIRSFLDDVYALKGEGGGAVDLDDIYPIGAIYMSVNSTSPSILFGGTWQRLEDTFLYATSGTADTGYQATGGEASHTLTTDEMPSHNHGSKSLTGNFRPIVYKSNPGNSGIVSLSGSNANDRTMTSKSSGGFGAQTYTVNATHTHDNNGGGQAHNNMPPYMKVYMWKRTA